MTTSIRFVPVEFDDIRESMRQHLHDLPGKIDSFLEEHIFTSAHVQIVIDGTKAGFVSIHDGSLITQFALGVRFRHFGQHVFAAVKELDGVRSAFVPTCDEFYLVHALDDYRELAKQAYFFTVRTPTSATDEVQLRAAVADDRELIARESGDIFGNLDSWIDSGDFFVTVRNGETVGFGVSERSRIYSNVASIGMFTSEQHRGQGVGTATISALIREMGSRGIESVAGCWYYNDPSKRTLERAGMYAPTRLLRFEFGDRQPG